MKREKDVDFDEMMVMKEKRRVSRGKEKRNDDNDGGRIKKAHKAKGGKRIDYDPEYDYDDYDYDE